MIRSAGSRVLKVFQIISMESHLWRELKNRYPKGLQVVGNPIVRRLIQFDPSFAFEESQLPKGNCTYGCILSGECFPVFGV